MDLNRKDIESSKEGLFHLVAKSENLLVTFGGVQQGIGIPVFEFFNSVKDLNCDKIFIRDFSQTWYQKGIDDETNHIDLLEKKLKDIIEENNFKKICFIGNSMGGYAAILLGSLLKINSVLSFAPQTFIDRKNRLINLDFRWRKEMREIHKNPSKKPEYFDLLNFLNKNNNPETAIEIFYSPKHRLDKIHAERLRGFKNIELIPTIEGGHNIIKTIRDTGELNTLLNSFFK